MFDDIAILSGTSNRMNYLTVRQQVLTENLANVDTPDYKARDLDQERFNRILKSGISPRLDLTRSSGQHIQAQYSASSLFPLKTDDFYEATISGNTVNNEETLMKLNQNAADYTMATTVYSKLHSFIGIAVSGR
ncbi:MAG: flagellar basal body rod protein FlgB [Alphaproteobacteria bacterium]|nr:flagellar basal body rod protein FlgB [Alphaproteobacteria bacterium]